MKQLRERKDPSGMSKFKTFLANHVLDMFSSRSYSQEGEDMILRRIFEQNATGFYVDVGACHPRRWSNTYFFYKKGWRGINVEPNPESIRLFEAQRSQDINLSMGVSTVAAERMYYMFNEPALNTFEEDFTKMPSRRSERYYLVGKIPVRVRRLEDILDEYLPKEKRIDFISIDVEGHELSVLQSNNWEKYRPKCLLVEVLDASIPIVIRSTVHDFMTAANYSLYAKTANTLFYLDDCR